VRQHCLPFFPHSSAPAAAAETKHIVHPLFPVCCVAIPVGGSALLVLLPGGQLQVKPYQHNPEAHDNSWQDPAWGQYRQRGCVLDMPIMVRVLKG
jgi:hypothetical protein